MNSRNATRILRVSALVTAILFALGACTNTRIVEKPVYVRIPVTEPCVTAIPEEPDYATKYLEPDDPIGIVGQDYRIEVRQRERYIDVLLAELAGCIKPEGETDHE